MLISGFPGSGKTGALASLANAGFKLRILDYDGNPEPLFQYVYPDKLKNIDIVTLEDPIGVNGQFVGVKGIPTAFLRGVQLMDRWRYQDESGEPDAKGVKWVDLGSSKDWGLDTIVVLDGITGMGAASMARAVAMTNKTLMTVSRPVWGLAMQEQMNFLKRLTSAQTKHHVIVLSHLKMIGPKEINQDDDSITREIKERNVDLIPTRFHPSGLGRELPPNIAGEFPIAITLEVKAKGTKVKRFFSYQPKEEMDLKLPIKDFAALGELGPRTGLLTIFQALGAMPPKEETTNADASTGTDERGELPGHPERVLGQHPGGGDAAHRQLAPPPAQRQHPAVKVGRR
jgi:hypothetical protein